MKAFGCSVVFEGRESLWFKNRKNFQWNGLIMLISVSDQGMRLLIHIRVHVSSYVKWVLLFLRCRSIVTI